MAGTDVTVHDSYGRRTVFKGEKLVSDTTDTDDNRKPRWIDIDIWRTEGGSYVVRRATHYGLVHASKSCLKLDGYEIRQPDADDVHACNSCNSSGQLTGGWAQASRITVDVYRTPGELIESMKFKGEHTRLSQSLLAELSAQDERINALWNTVVVD